MFLDGIDEDIETFTKRNSILSEREEERMTWKTWSDLSTDSERLFDIIWIDSIRTNRLVTISFKLMRMRYTVFSSSTFISEVFLSEPRRST